MAEARALRDEGQPLPAAQQPRQTAASLSKAGISLPWEREL